MGIDHYGDLLRYAHSRVYPWINRLRGFYTLFRLRTLPPFRALRDPHSLRVAEAEEELLKEMHFKKKNYVNGLLFCQ